MKISGLDHLFFRPRDLRRSLRFYRDVLGLPCAPVGAPDDPECVLVAFGGGTRLVLGRPAGAPEAFAGGLAISLQVEDPDVFARECAARGLELHEAPHDSHWGTRLFSARDPDGLELHFERPLEKR